MKCFSALIAAAALAALLSGCQYGGAAATGSSNRPDAIDQVQLGLRMASVIEESQHVTQRSRPDEIEQILEQLHRVDRDLSSLGKPDESSRIRLSLVRAEIERLARARRIQEIQTSLIDRIRELGEEDQPLSSETRNRLRAEDAAVAELDNQLRTAERQYTDSVNQSRKLIRALDGLNDQESAFPASPGTGQPG